MPQPSTTTPDLRERWGLPRFGYRANHFMLWLGGRFLPLACVIVWFAALYFFLFAPKARRASMDYLARIHKKKRTLIKRGWQTYRHLTQFGFLLLDRALMLARKDHRFSMVSSGRENLLAALAQNRGLLMLTAHFGNAEAAAPYLAKNGLTRPIHLVMYQEPGDSTERFHTDHRRLLADMQIISTQDPLVAGVKIIRALRGNDVVAIRADRALDGRTVPATLLGATVHLPAGPFLAAALSNAPVVNVYTARIGYRNYTCTISSQKSYGDPSQGTRDERTQLAADDYAAFLEQQLLQHPFQWSNFYDFWPAPNPPTPPAAKIG